MIVEASVNIDGDDARLSYVVGRNGTWTPKTVGVWQGGSLAHIEATGTRGVIRGGITMPAKNMDVLAMRWLQARGFVMPAR